MLAEENKNAGTSALEGKEVLQASLLSHLPPHLRRLCLLIKRRKKEKRAEQKANHETVHLNPAAIITLNVNVLN